MRLADYIDWAQAVGAALADEAVEGLDYFGRFAKRIPPLGDDSGAPKSILLDLWDILKADDETFAARNWKSDVANRILARGNTCYLIHAEDVGKRTDYFFEFEIDGDDGGVQQYRVDIDYKYRATVPPSARYVLRSASLNALLEVEDATGTDEPGAFGKSSSASLTRIINQEQAFRIIPARNGAVYAHGHFYTPEVGPDVLEVLEQAEGLAEVVSEKGDTRLDDAAAWNTKTLFGLVYGWFGGVANPSAIAADLRTCDFLINPDGTREIADFFAVSDAQKKVLVIHAKSQLGAGAASARDLEEVSRQAQASLAFAGSSRHIFKRPNVWGQVWRVRLRQAANAQIQRSRVVGRAPLAAPTAHRRLLAALANPTYAKEIVILTSGIISAAAAAQAFHDANPLDLQFIYYLASLRTSFDRAGVRLRIVAND